MSSNKIIKWISELIQEITDSKVKSKFNQWLHNDINDNGISDYLEPENTITGEIIEIDKQIEDEKTN